MNHYISTYTRQDAINDGFLIPLDPTLTKAAGFIFPIAVTHTVWESYIDWTDEDTQLQTYQDIEGRAWVILHMLRLQIKRQGGGSVINFSVYIIPRDKQSKKPKWVKLQSTCGPGDEGEPVITIMLPGED